MSERNPTQSATQSATQSRAPAPVMPRLPGRVSVREVRRAAARAGRDAAYASVMRAGSAFRADDAATVAIAVGVGRILVGDAGSIDVMPEMVSA